MKRIAWWSLSTLSAVVMMFGYHTSVSGAVDASAAPTPTAIHSSASSGSTSSAGSGGSKSSAATTVTGTAADTRYGPVQVAITVSGGAITDVAVPQYPNGNSQDVQINQQAVPVLIRETLDQQTATIDMVSGATYTSDGYRQSLQSALDQANL